MTEPTTTEPAQPTESAAPVRIFLLDDPEIVRRGLVDLLDSVPEFEVGRRGKHRRRGAGADPGGQA